MAKPTLVLYVDVVSPFAYLAFHLITVSGVGEWHSFFLIRDQALDLKVGILSSHADSNGPEH